MIDLALAAGDRVTSIAATYNVHRTSLSRHANNCSTALKARATVEHHRSVDAAALAATILDDMLKLHEKSRGVLDQAIAQKATFGEIGKLIREERESIRMVANLIGAFPDEPVNTTTNIVDQRTQTVTLAIGDMSADEIRNALTALGRGKATIDAE